MSIVPMLQAGADYDAIGAVFGKSRKTITRWAAHPDVVAALEAARDRSREVSEDRATVMVRKAWDTIDRLLDSEDSKVALDAAKTTLSRLGAPEATKTEGKHDVDVRSGLSLTITKETARAVIRATEEER